MKTKEQKLAERNAAFLKMTKSEKRVAIAHDVIKSLRTNLAQAKQGSYGWFMAGAPAPTEPADACYTCALGNILVSACRLTDAVVVTNIGGGARTWLQLDHIQKGLEPYFKLGQLSLIEDAFEVTDVRSSRTSLADRRRAIAFGKRFRTPKTRLVAIMKNVIDNDGEFLP